MMLLRTAASTAFSLELNAAFVFSHTRCAVIAGRDWVEARVAVSTASVTCVPSAAVTDSVILAARLVLRLLARLVPRLSVKVVANVAVVSCRVEVTVVSSGWRS